MKNTLILISIIIACHANLWSQFVKIEMSVNDCIKFQDKIISLFDHSEIPFFIVFDKESEVDTNEIYRYLLPKLHNKIVFTNRFSKNRKMNISYLEYWDKEGSNALSVKLLNTNESTLDSIKNLYFQNNNDVQISIIESYRDGWHIKHNYFTSSIVYDSVHHSYKVLMNDSIFQKIVSSIKMSEPQFYSLTEQAIEENSLSKNAVMVNVTNHYFSKGRMFLLVEVPYVHPPTKKEIENGIKGSIQKKYVVMQQKNGINEKIYSLDIDNGDYQILPTAFMANGIEEFYFIHIPKENKDFKDKRFLAKYKIEDNKLVFDKKLSVHYPEFFFKSGIGYSLSPIFLYSFYPYLVQMSGNKVYNLSSDTELEFSYSLVSDIKDIDSTYIEQLHQGASFPITNLYVFPVNNNKFGLITRIEKVDYLYVFSDNEGIMKELYKIKLSDKGIYLSEYPVFNIDKKKEYFYYQDNNKIMRGLPLDFLIN